MTVQNPVATRKNEPLASLPAARPETDLRDRIRQALVSLGRKMVVLDGEPTGTRPFTTCLC